MTSGRLTGGTGPIAGQWDLFIETTRDDTSVFRSKNRIFIRRGRATTEAIDLSAFVHRAAGVAPMDFAVEGVGYVGCIGKIESGSKRSGIIDAR